MRVEVAFREPASDGRAWRLTARAQESAPAVTGIRLADVYLLDAPSDFDERAAAKLFCDPVAQIVTIDRPVLADAGVALVVEVSPRPGVADPVAATARKAIETEVGHPLADSATVLTAAQYAFLSDAAELASGEAVRVAAALYNPLIQQAVVLTGAEWRAGKRFPAHYPLRVAPSPREVVRFDLRGMTDGELAALSTRRLLALSREELRAIQTYYRSEETERRRGNAGLGPEATDVELEMIAQTWSEHCKHKIFNATIHYREGGRDETIRSLFATYIKRTTEEVAVRKGFLKSVFSDNAGVIEFDDDNLVCFKVETHNSPSALDPYGGAITGIVGVNRDILGTGKGARPIFNTDVLCFGNPGGGAPLPGLLSPRRVLEGVHRGIVDGGNQSGIPVVAGAFEFDDSFAGKPLVFCGTGGLLPARILGEPGWTKRIEAGDAAVMLGGRIGKDGIHGATFSSLALDETSPTSAVQIGDPIVQRKMADFLLEARDLGLFKGITDNGAGGLSSSLGEMAQEAGGIRIDLDACPLKYEGLAPWEVLLSESQERMSLSVAPAELEGLLALARGRDVEATVVGWFTASGLVEVFDRGLCVASVSLEFLHRGLPVMELEAEWAGAEESSAAPVWRRVDPNEVLLRLLEDPTIASKEPLIRQFDHEVIGQSVVKPFVGALSDGPSDGAVLRPVPGSYRGLTVTHGLCPSYSDVDTYWMAMCAVDEAFRAHISLGGDPRQVAALDNFCWPDPVESEETPDGRRKLAQLVRACRGLRDACVAYNIPLISGKDSMKNDARVGGQKLSIKPTLLVSLVGIIEDVRRAVTSDFKRSGDLVYLLGETRNELRASRFERITGLWSGGCPTVATDSAMRLYQRYHRAAAFVASCHDLADGGLAVAIAESAIGGRFGADIDLSGILGEQSQAAVCALLFGETPSRLLATVSPGNAPGFEEHLGDVPFAKIGATTESGRLSIRAGATSLVDLALDTVTTAWKRPFGVR